MMHLKINIQSPLFLALIYFFLKQFLLLKINPIVFLPTLTQYLTDKKQSDNESVLPSQTISP